MQVFPLLIQHLSFEEQAGLVWQFICSIPVNLMEEFLPWIASCLSSEERQAMIACMHSVVPKEDLLRKVLHILQNSAKTLFYLGKYM
jgi:zinc finger-like protein